MNYFRWRRKIKACATVFLLSACALWLLLLNEIIEFQRANYIPVKIQYPLGRIPENHAVMVIEKGLLGVVGPIWWEAYIVNKKGDWKIIKYPETIDIINKYHENENQYNDFYEFVLQNESIPWQKEKIAINSAFLERALNMPEVGFARQACEGEQTWKRTMNIKVWYLQDNRGLCVYYDNGIPEKYDYTVMYIQKKFNQLDDMGERVMQK